MLTQQEILRGFMSEAGMTRDGFCKKYQSSRRALDGWLLPSDSNGFRVIPEALLSEVESDYIELLDGVIQNAPDVSDEVKSKLVSFHNGVKNITFPPLYLLKDVLEIPKDFIPYVKNYRGQKSYVCETFNLDGSPTSATNLISSEAELYEKPRTLYWDVDDVSSGQNYWTYLFHFNTKSACRTAYDVTAQIGLIDHPDLFGSVCFEGEYFYMVAKPAEAHYNKPLFIYQAKFLHKNKLFPKLFPEIYYEYWEKVIDESGNEIQIPSKDDDDEI